MPQNTHKYANSKVSQDLQFPGGSQDLNLVGNGNKRFSNMLLNEPPDLSLEYFIRDFISQMYPELTGHVSMITGNVMKILENMNPVKHDLGLKRFKRFNIDKNGKDNYDWSLFTLNDLVTRNKLRLR